ncbi:hypothetical protein D9611_009343 [Ephemerocybe angulata]|uniref:Transmembrane protein 188 n=1 Tax=Ephemerocybe angulata TaxID=980116 RepID=A0A8H5BGI8_9AGAR|nr:hypothetical protein D9611_009343 [Tulosesus angulatus]
MPPRTNDNTAYRDVLMFEERLKTTAVSLQRRKARYQFFLAQLVLVIAVLLCEVLLPPDTSILVIPYRMTLQYFIGPAADEIKLHPYIATGMLFVAVTTLLLFFASGMYSEKIAYANKYVPHANRALRSFNMVLNVRKPSLRSKFAWNPINFFFPRPPQPSDSSARTPSPSRSARSRSSSVSRPMASLPPASNPRGELVFSSRVDKSFRDGYERYRSAFERKRAEKARAEARKTWWGRLLYRELEPAPTPAPGQPQAGRSVSASSTSSNRGRGGGTQSRSATPPTSSPLMMKGRDRSRSPPSTPSPPGTPRRERRRREEGEVSMRTLAIEKSFEHSQAQR